MDIHFISITDSSDLVGVLVLVQKQLVEPYIEAAASRYESLDCYVKLSDDSGHRYLRTSWPIERLGSDGISCSGDTNLWTRYYS